MKKDFDLITYKFDNEITIIPIFDKHYGSEDFLSKKWQEVKEKILSTPDTYIVIGGDMINNNTRGGIGNVFADTVRPREQKEWLVKELKPLAELGKILCITAGNHENRSEKDCDDNPLYDVACKLNLEDIYRPNMCFLKIQIGKRDESYRQTYTVGVTHGSAGGALTGSSVNKNERFAYTFNGLDCLITGHTHKVVESYPDQLVIDAKNNKITFKTMVVITATSWTGYGDYALRKQMAPASFRIQKLTFKKQKEKDIEINNSSNI